MSTYTDDDTMSVEAMSSEELGQSYDDSIELQAEPVQEEGWFDDFFPADDPTPAPVEEETVEDLYAEDEIVLEQQPTGEWKPSMGLQPEMREDINEFTAGGTAAATAFRDSIMDPESVTDAFTAAGVATTAFGELLNEVGDGWGEQIEGLIGSASGSYDETGESFLSETGEALGGITGEIIEGGVEIVGTAVGTVLQPGGDVIAGVGGIAGHVIDAGIEAVWNQDIGAAFEEIGEAIGSVTMVGEAAKDLGVGVLGTAGEVVEAGGAIAWAVGEGGVEMGIGLARDTYAAGEYVAEAAATTYDQFDPPEALELDVEDDIDEY